jgi:hypothetical protein
VKGPNSQLRMVDDECTRGLPSRGALAECLFCSMGKTITKKPP